MRLGIGNPAGIGKGTGFGLRERDRDGIGLGHYRLRANKNSEIFQNNNFQRIAILKFLKIIPHLFKILLKLIKIVMICKEVQNNTNNEATINQNP